MAPFAIMVKTVSRCQQPPFLVHNLSTISENSACTLENQGGSLDWLYRELLFQTDTPKEPNDIFAFLHV